MTKIKKKKESTEHEKQHKNKRKTYNIMIGYKIKQHTRTRKLFIYFLVVVEIIIFNAMLKIPNVDFKNKYNKLKM